MRVLVTQPVQDTGPTVDALHARGHSVVSAPVIITERVASPKINLAAAQGFVVTGAEAARALADAVGVRTFPVFTDSALTASLLETLGFTAVAAAKDDSADLARLIERSLKPAGGALIHACNTNPAINLGAMLSNMGFALRALPLYSVKRVLALPAEIAAGLRDKSFDAALFLSADEARAFVGLTQLAQLDAAVAGIAAVAATPVVAAPLRALKFRGVTVPTSGLLADVVATLETGLVDRVAEERRAAEARAREAEERARAEAERQRAEEERRQREEAERQAEAERRQRELDEQRRAAEERERQRVLAEEARLAAAREQEQQRRAEAERARAAERAREEEERLRRKQERELELAQRRQEEDARAATLKKEKEEQAAKARALAEEERRRRDQELAQRRQEEDVRAAALKKEKEEYAAKARALAEDERRRRDQELAQRRQEEDVRAAAFKKEKEEQTAEARAAAEAERERRRQEQESMVEARRREDEARDRAAAEQRRLRAEQQRVQEEQNRLLAEQRREAEAIARAQAEEAAAARALEEAHLAEKLALERAEAARIKAEQNREQRERRAQEQAAREAERQRVLVAEARVKAAAKAERERLATAEAERLRAAEDERFAQEQARLARVAAERARQAEDLLRRKQAQAEFAAQERALSQKTRSEQALAGSAEAVIAEAQARVEATPKEAPVAPSQEQARLEAEQYLAAEAAERERIAREQKAFAEAQAAKAERERRAQEAAAYEEHARAAEVQRRAQAARQDEENARYNAEQERLKQEKAAHRAAKRAAEKAEAARIKAEKEALKSEQREAAREARMAAEVAAAAARVVEQTPAPQGGFLKGFWQRFSAVPASGPRWDMAVTADAEQPSRSSLAAHTETETVAGARQPDHALTFEDSAPQPTPAIELEPLSAPPPFATMPPNAAATSMSLDPIEASDAPLSAPAQKPIVHTTAPEPGPEPSGEVARQEPIADAPPRAEVPLRGGRAARLLAEDAADEKAHGQRFRNFGFGETPEAEPERRAGDAAPERPEPQRPEPQRAEPQPTATRRRRRSPILLFLLLAVVAAAAFYSAPLWMPRLAGTSRPNPAPLTDALKALDERMATLDQQAANNAAALTALQHQGAAPAQTPAPASGTIPAAVSNDAIDSLSASLTSQAQQLAALSARLATLEAAIGNTARLEDEDKRVTALEARAADAASVLVLSDRVTALETAARQGADQRTTAVALLVALGQWHEALAAGRPFGLELETAKTLAARSGSAFDDTAFAAYSGRGLPTTADMRQSFEATAAAVVRADLLPASTNGWLRRVLERVMSIATIRRTDGDTAGSSAGAIVARAESRLRADDLPAAVSELGADGGASDGHRALARGSSRAGCRGSGGERGDHKSSRGAGRNAAAMSGFARLILYVLIVSLVVAGAVWLANDPGSVTLDWRGWRVDTSVGVLIAALVVILCVIGFLFRLASALSRGVRAIAAKRRERRLKRGLTSLGDGFAAVMAGQRDAALKFAREASALLKDNVAVLVLRKEAAALQGNRDAVEAAAQDMLARPETELAGLRSLATAALARNDVVSAGEYARRAWLRRDAPSWALTMLLDLDIAAGRWDDALALLDGKPARLAYGPEEHGQLRAKLFVRTGEAALAKGDATSAAVAAKRAMGAGGHSREAIVVFARAMAALGKGRKAAGEVERAWAQAPHPSLLAAYRALVPGESALDWAKRVENLVEAAPDHAESRLAVAEAALNAELWGQARNRLSGLTAEGVDPDVRARAARLLAELESRQRGDAEAAADWLKVALDFRESKRAAPAKPRTAAELLAQAG